MKNLSKNVFWAKFNTFVTDHFFRVNFRESLEKSKISPKISIATNFSPTFLKRAIKNTQFKKKFKKVAEIKHIFFDDRK